MKKLVKFDWAVKKLLRSKANFAVLEGFLTELLKEDLKIKKILESEGNKETFNDKFNRVDILVENSQGEILIIEVQVEDQLDYIQRLIYGTSKIITEYIKEAQAYGELKKVISISILYFDIGQGEDYVYHGTTKLIGIHNHKELALSPKQRQKFKKERIHELFPEYYLIKVNQFNDLAKDKLDEWIYFLKNEEIKDSFTAQGLAIARKKLDIMKLSDVKRKEYEKYLESLHDRASFYESTFVQGENKGKKIGEKIGVKKGEKIGMEKGVKKGLKEALQKMIASGLSEADARKILQ